MITKVEARGFRCLKKVEQTLKPYQILVGPNASGKSAFLDVIAFLGDLSSVGLKEAIEDRTENFHDLVWGREDDSFLLAIEARVPPNLKFPDFRFDPETVRYEVRLKLDSPTDEVRLVGEKLQLLTPSEAPQDILLRSNRLTRFVAETGHEPKAEFRFDLGPQYAGLSNLPKDEVQFPVANWLRDLLREGVQLVALDSQYLRAASAPGQGKPRVFDGLNLARVVSQFSDKSRPAFDAWIRHVRTALPDLDTVKAHLRPEDKHRWLAVRYQNGLEVPAWMLSDGTLRILALTLLAYIPDFRGMYLIEEPEIGVHPTALETIVQSLSSIYDGQVLVTSHSPLVLGISEPSSLLCFKKTDQGTIIVAGDQHPLLQEWRSSANLSDLFAAGVLG
jgi:predicted ATPase